MGRRTGCAGNGGTLTGMETRAHKTLWRIAPVVLAAALLLAGCSWKTRRIETAGTTTNRTGDVMVHTFENGITLLHHRVRDSGIVAVAWMSVPGAASDPDEKTGRTHLAMRLLTKGTRTRSADEISEALEDLGARVSTSASHEYVSAGLQCVRGDLPRAFEILSDVLIEPTFPIDEIRLEKKRVLSEIRVRDDRPSGAAMKRLRDQLFSPGPYGRPVDGEPETIEALTQTDLVDAHARFAVPDQMIVSIVGDVPFEDAVLLVQERLGALPATDRPDTQAGQTWRPRAALEQIVRNVEQSFIASGYITCPVTHEDTPALDVMTAVLGQGMSSRMFVRLRDEKGLAYGVGAFGSGQRNAGYMVAWIGTTPERICESLDGIAAEIEAVRLEPVTAAELDRAKAYLIGGYLRDHETNGQKASHLAYWHFTGLGPEYDARYPDLVRAVTTRDVMRVANKYLTDPATVLVRPEEPLPECLDYSEKPVWKYLEDADEVPGAPQDAR